MILGSRGVPAQHGGFETFAEQLAKFLIARDWNVSVYCQIDGSGPISSDEWLGVKRILVPVASSGSISTIQYDLKCTLHARERPGVILTLGYNTAIFSAAYLGRSNKWGGHLMNMDGIEWRRDKWSLPIKAWFWLNEIAGTLFSDHLVADNPHIQTHLQRFGAGKRCTVIPYSAEVHAKTASPGTEGSIFSQLGLGSEPYGLVIARPEPENSILQIVRAYSASPRPYRLVVLGKFTPQSNPYHRAVLAAASTRVLFPGAIYDSAAVAALRQHCLCYVHGHTVGGTNPSLVEALAHGSPVIAHDNPFNRWVAAEAASYFSDEADCVAAFDALAEGGGLLERQSQVARARFESQFNMDHVMGQYERLLRSHLR